MGVERVSKTFPAQMGQGFRSQREFQLSMQSTLGLVLWAAPKAQWKFR